MKAASQLLTIATAVATSIAGYRYASHSARIAEIQRALDAKELEAARGGFFNMASIQIPPLRQLLANAESERSARTVPVFLLAVGLGVAALVVRRSTTSAKDS